MSFSRQEEATRELFMLIFAFLGFFALIGLTWYWYYESWVFSLTALLTIGGLVLFLEGLNFFYFSKERYNAIDAQISKTIQIVVISALLLSILWNIWTRNAVVLNWVLFSGVVMWWIIIFFVLVVRPIPEFNKGFFLFISFLWLFTSLLIPVYSYSEIVSSLNTTITSFYDALEQDPFAKKGFEENYANLLETYKKKQCIVLPWREYTEYEIINEDPRQNKIWYMLWKTVKAGNIITIDEKCSTLDDVFAIFFSFSPLLILLLIVYLVIVRKWDKWFEEN
jgi:hypothetical protein